ncbi:hypothetical protein [Mucisphaera sp.]|uniref:hypothetical protein n=1 Tax=Mucisphaera sp. TaxID=2913024 RepID=UPI003D0A59E3
MDQERRLRVVAVTRKPDAASYEQRVKHYLEPLAASGIDVEERVIPDGTWRQRRFYCGLGDFDVVWWQRHLAQPWHLRVIRRHAKRLVFDFDDPLTVSAAGGGKASWSRRRRFAWMLGACDVVTTASEHLAGLARAYCGDVRVVPMAIDLPDEGVLPVSERPGPPTLLWLGSRATQPYLSLIRPALERLAGRVVLRLIAHEPMRFGGLDVDFRRWSEVEQTAALRECHVGLCPMPDTAWTRGKCPYKVLQYMAYGMPWVGSAVGENLVVAGVGRAGPGDRGWCAAGQDDWVDAIDAMTAGEQRVRTGEAGRSYIEAVHARERLVGAIAGALSGRGGGQSSRG